MTIIKHILFSQQHNIMQSTPSRKMWLEAVDDDIITECLFDLLLEWRWHTVYNAEQVLGKHWVSLSCLSFLL